jgi:hypothetical protein
VNRVCLAFGVATLLLAIVGTIRTPKNCGEDGGLGPVVALELVRSSTELEALVRTPECAAGLRETTYGDMALFIPSFTAFLIAGALMIGRRLAVVMFGLGAVFDQLEDVVMLHLLDMPFATFEWLSALFFASRLKFLALSVGVVLLGWSVKRAHGAAMVVGGGVAMLGVVIEHRLIMPGTLVAWIALAWWSVVRRS